LKSKNILLNFSTSQFSDIKNCKLCDFGVSKILSESTLADTYRLFIIFGLVWFGLVWFGLVFLVDKKKKKKDV
jgi:hypothetical protein